MALTRFLIFIVTINALGSGECLAKACSLSSNTPDSSVASGDDLSLKSAVTTKRPCQCTGLPPCYLQSAIDLRDPLFFAASTAHPQPFKPKNHYSTYYSGLSPPARFA